MKQSLNRTFKHLPGSRRGISESTHGRNSPVASLLYWTWCWHSFPGFMSIINTKCLDSWLSQSNASARLHVQPPCRGALAAWYSLKQCCENPWPKTIGILPFESIGIIWILLDIYLHQGWAANEILWSKFSWQHCSPIGASLVLALWTSLAAWSSSKFPFQIKPLSSL